MKKALLLLIGIVAVSFLIGNAAIINDFLDTLQTGAIVPLVIAGALMLARHLVQAESYDAAFEAVGYRTGFWHNVILIFSLVFINTFCLFSGATGVAFIIDDARRRGADLGTATSGAILSQIGYFAAVFVISVIGFTTMLVSGNMNTAFLLGGLVLAGTLVVLSSLFFAGYFKPDLLYWLFERIERIVSSVLKRFKRSLRPAWGSQTADSFIDSARILGSNPLGALSTVAWAAFSAILNMACLVAIGFAFGFEVVEALVAAFAVAAISVILSPTPQGVGVVEAAIAMILTAYGCSLTTATAIALVYRGIMFWIPFCIGAVLLSQSGFFKEKKDPTKDQKYRDVAWISGTLLAILGLVNIGVAQFHDMFAPYETLTQFVNFGGLVGSMVVVIGAILVLLAVGLVMRLRVIWALAITLVVLLAGGEFLFTDTLLVAIPMVALAVWLFWQRDAFSLPFSKEAIRKLRGVSKATSDCGGEDGDPKACFECREERAPLSVEELTAIAASRRSSVVKDPEVVRRDSE